jgi:tetratricopeptide (TPR) repeat protein
MTMARKTEWIWFLFFLFAIILKKTGFGLSSLILTVATLSLCLHNLFRKDFHISFLNRIQLLLIVLFSFALIQYLFPIELVAIPFLVLWIIFSLISIKAIRKNIFGLLQWSICGLIILSAVIFNPREFHNFYRSSKYEEYIRSQYPANQGIVADYFIDKYKKPDKESADKYLQSAINFDTSDDKEHALEMFNKSIDANPDNAEATYKRGLFKLTRLDLDAEIAYSAIKDFDRALRLDSTITMAHFHRGLAYGYIGNKGRSFVDMKKVWYADSTLTDEQFLKKYGSSKKSFSVPFHP